MIGAFVQMLRSQGNKCEREDRGGGFRREVQDGGSGGTKFRRNQSSTTVVDGDETYEQLPT